MPLHPRHPSNGGLSRPAWSGRAVVGLLIVAALAAIALPEPALAAEGNSGGSEGLLVGQVVLLIVAGRLLGEAMLRLGQPAIMGQLIAGILLGPSVLGALWPGAEQFLFPKSPEQRAMLNGIAQFGILLLLVLTGMETELSLVRHVKRAAASVSIAGIALPFACGFALGELLPDALLPDPGKRLVTSLFLGTAMAISSVKIVASVVRDMGFLRRNVGQVILASAIVDDTIGWIIIAVTLGLAGQENFSWTGVAMNVIGTLLFLGFSFTLGRKLVFRIIQFSNDHFRGEAPVIAAILVVMGVFALITDVIGVHTVLGAFVAGILVGESPILTEEIDKQFRGLVAGLFMPVFFGLAGLSADLTVLKDPYFALLTLGLIMIASFGKAAGAFTGGYFGGLTGRRSVALAMGMNARGSTEVIVATIGLSMGVLSQNLFTMIVAMAVITTTAMPTTLRWALQRLPMRAEEKKRLEREEYEQGAFVPNLERVLVAVDDSANARFASRIAGLLAGSRGMPVTVLDITEAKDGGGEDKSSLAAQAVEIVKAAALAAAPKDDSATIDIIARQHDAPPADAIAEEARRGYDLLVIGIDPVMARGGFHADLSALVSDFQGSLAIVDARGAHQTNPEQPVKKILVPVTGNEYSRRGAEVAMALATAAGAEVEALSVIGREAKNKNQRRRETDVVADEIKRIATHNAAQVKTTLRANMPTEDAIKELIERGQHDLLVMGVSRRPGETLSFGDVAAGLLNSAKCSLMFVAPQARASAKSSTKAPQAAAAE